MVSFGYDNVGNRTSFTDGRSKVTTYTYTNRHELASITYPDSTSEAYTYNAVGQLASRRDGRFVYTYLSYDDAGRLTGKTYSNGDAALSFAYDNDNRRTGMTDGTGTTPLERRVPSRSSLPRPQWCAVRGHSRRMFGQRVAS
ncbi:MAG: hypothetical protein OHK0029_41170 [Armatimonadaceae bacterium]